MEDAPLEAQMMSRLERYAKTRWRLSIARKLSSGGEPSGPTHCQVSGGRVDVRMSWSGMEWIRMVGTGEKGRDVMFLARTSAR